MLALNSYGLTSRNNTKGERIVLPRFCGSSLPVVREIRSLTKLDMLTHTQNHLLYRTTTGDDYGRFADFKAMALSCPKHAKSGVFTKTFNGGNYVDTSLLSLENRKRRADMWQQKMAARTIQMQAKCANLQLVLEEKKQLRRLRREKQRREMDNLRVAITRLQARMRGYLTRRRLQQEKLRRDSAAAQCIQRASRSRARVRHAKLALQSRRQERQQACAIRIQHMFRCFVLRKRAKQELMELREAKRQKEIRIEQELQSRRVDAASTIQRLGRAFLVRKAMEQLASSSTVVAQENVDKDSFFSVSNRIRGHNARRVIARMQQAQRKQSKPVFRVPFK